MLKQRTTHRSALTVTISPPGNAAQARLQNQATTEAQFYTLTIMLKIVSLVFGSFSVLLIIIQSLSTAPAQSSVSYSKPLVLGIELTANHATVALAGEEMFEDLGRVEASAGYVELVRKLSTWRTYGTR